MPLSAVASTTETTSSLVSVVNCYRGCNQSRMQLVTVARRSDRMTPILRQLHWLPVCQRITFKTAVLVYKCWHGMVSPYLSTYCEPTSSHGRRCHLRTAEFGQLAVSRTRTNYGDRSFAIHGSVMRNSLPADLRLLNISLPVFRKRLKMFLFTV